MNVAVDKALGRVELIGDPMHDTPLLARAKAGEIICPECVHKLGGRHGYRKGNQRVMPAFCHDPGAPKHISSGPQLEHKAFRWLLGEDAAERLGFSWRKEKRLRGRQMDTLLAAPKVIDAVATILEETGGLSCVDWHALNVQRSWLPFDDVYAQLADYLAAGARSVTWVFTTEDYLAADGGPSRHKMLDTDLARSSREGAHQPILSRVAVGGMRPRCISVEEGQVWIYVMRDASSPFAKDALTHEERFALARWAFYPLKHCRWEVPDSPDRPLLLTPTDQHEDTARAKANNEGTSIAKDVLGFGLGSWEPYLRRSGLRVLPGQVLRICDRDVLINLDEDRKQHLMNDRCIRQAWRSVTRGGRLNWWLDLGIRQIGPLF